MNFCECDHASANKKLVFKLGIYDNQEWKTLYCKAWTVFSPKIRIQQTVVDCIKRSKSIQYIFSKKEPERHCKNLYMRRRVLKWVFFWLL